MPPCGTWSTKHHDIATYAGQWLGDRFLIACGYFLLRSHHELRHCADRTHTKSWLGRRCDSLRVSSLLGKIPKIL